jgi:hypothetical protein
LEGYGRIDALGAYNWQAQPQPPPTPPTPTPKPTVKMLVTITVDGKPQTQELVGSEIKVEQQIVSQTS